MTCLHMNTIIDIIIRLRESTVLLSMNVSIIIIQVLYPPQSLSESLNSVTANYDVIIITDDDYILHTYSGLLSSSVGV